MHVDQAEVHLPGVVGKNAHVDDFVSEPMDAGPVIAAPGPHQQNQPPPDACSLLRSVFVPGYRPGRHPLGDESHVEPPEPDTLIDLWAEMRLCLDQRVDVAKTFVPVL